MAAVRHGVLDRVRPAKEVWTDFEIGRERKCRDGYGTDCIAAGVLFGKLFDGVPLFYCDDTQDND
jgi:hypothetical protein